jgi:hypothetical protein
MSLFPDKDILPREIESWRGYAQALRMEDRRLFERMLERCYRYAGAVNAKPEALSTEALLMSILLEQEKEIERLEKSRGNNSSGKGTESR